MGISGCPCILCTQSSREASWDQRDRTIAASTRDHGWHVMGVHADDDTPAGWAYSIGLWHTLRSPEICVFGLAVDTMMPLINAAGDAVVNGPPLMPDQRRNDIFDHVPAVIRPVHESWCTDFFGAGLDFYQVSPLPVAQLFWPDREGCFPWEDGAADYCRDNQPLLWIPKPDTPGPWGAS
ncbi:DUF4262 domain-containing protein [Streptomyces sp. R41]|uniref:DUF4262 domain-containing protein n=1 Tax=Streptomyces sp. R41 TaxID=3238632 RepID=A0AB39R330_9ACTN